MAEERRKKRPHAEVVAAREQYLKEREARQQARAERRVEREKLQAERLARKEQREKLKNMTDSERAQVKYEQKLEKARKASKHETHPINKIPPYQGDLKEGTYYTVRFAGSLIYGCFKGEIAAGIDEESGMRRRYSLFAFESKEPGTNPWIYPVTRENILCEGTLVAEKCNGLMNPVFNGISYY